MPKKLRVVYEPRKACTTNFRSTCWLHIWLYFLERLAAAPCTVCYRRSALLQFTIVVSSFEGATEADNARCPGCLRIVLFCNKSSRICAKFVCLDISRCYQWYILIDSSSCRRNSRVKSRPPRYVLMSWPLVVHYGLLRPHVISVTFILTTFAPLTALYSFAVKAISWRAA